MIKRIQTYILLHYPTLWNLRLVPMLLILSAIHLIVFSISYIITDTEFNKTYYSHSSSSMELLYTASILICILLLVAWLIYYNRNNAFKSLYPKRIKQLYLEWIMIFLITSGITLIPLTLTGGYISKWKSVTTLAEAQKALKILEDAKVLIPNSEDNYTYKGYDKPIPIPENMLLDVDKLDLSLYDTEYDYQSGLIIKGYTGPSLLFYNYYYAYYYKDKPEYSDNESAQKIKRHKQIKQWLTEGNKDSIYSIMKDFTGLQKRHNLTINLTTEEWYKRIYNPPFFPVKESTIIMNCSPYEYEYSYDNYTSNIAVEQVETDATLGNDYMQTLSKTPPYLQYLELEAGYNEIVAHYDHTDIKWIFLICICFSLSISIIVFSHRVTSGKSWLIALVSTGIIIFISCLTAIVVSEAIDWENRKYVVIFTLVLWNIFFIVLLSKIIIKIVSRKKKGLSMIYMNILLWLIPCQLLFAFFSFMIYQEILGNYDYNKDDFILNIFFINIPIVILMMLPACALIRNWKSLAEE
ncbi:hypothetical protein JGH11_13035 [Dysgonomonas sp. Marseille-P4677]|uniref:hypothetical protein n=1 Tax=Dysgonomonas sp. Marseille-P4677 TaxID=2364790 RepID=UPI0019137B17|nr:hypothetical protein [Dysgonomonas sp. Marseille-P4677]MBK5721798.1 hypothetical protein [Dysgonomonas sp. Marseille-P4677]